MRLPPKPGNIPKKKTVAKLGSDSSGGVVPVLKKKRTRKGSKKNRERHKKRAQKKYVSKVKLLRAHDIRVRAGGARIGIVYPKIHPKIMSHDDISRWDDQGYSAMVRGFYDRHGDYNRYLILSEDGEKNISNPDGELGGGRGVFAREDIPAGKALCPYVGLSKSRPCPFDDLCQYDLRVDKAFYLCARHQLYDSAYLALHNREFFGPSGLDSRTKSEPNYGRFVNTVLPDQVQPGCFNAKFEHCRDGHTCIFIQSLRDISKGEEILVDYGSLYFTAPGCASPVSETGTIMGSDSEDEDLDDVWKPSTVV